MASTFKTLLNDDVVNTRTLLHEAIPITGTIVSGTYNVAAVGATAGAEYNVKTYTHGMFESTYDYPYLSSSANHIFDITYGYCASDTSSIVDTANTQNAKKINIYNQFAQVLMGYKAGGEDNDGVIQPTTIRKFDSDGTLAEDETGLMDSCFFLSFSRLLVKDEIKKGSFRLLMFPSGSDATTGSNSAVSSTIGDYDALDEYRTSPAGDYGLLFKDADDATDNTNSIGLIFYQAGVAVLTSSYFAGAHSFGHVGATTVSWGDGSGTGKGTAGSADAMDGTAHHALKSGSIEDLAKGFRKRWKDCDFNNTIELNSTVYFARINHNEYNYSSNPTYVSNSKLVVKKTLDDLPVTYITTVGLYSPDNELLAVAKLSEPLRKDPNTELTLRVRLDY